MDKYKFTSEGLESLSMRELVEIAADMDIPNRLEFPKPQLVGTILKWKARSSNRTGGPGDSRKLAPHET